MATLIVARTSMAPLLSVLVLLGALVSGQTIAPANATVPSVLTQLTVTGTTNLNPNVFNIAPLTTYVGLGQSQAAINQVTFNGIIQAVGPSNVNDVFGQDISYISCDPNTSSSNIDPSTVLQDAGTMKPRGIILYSTTSNLCNLTGSTTYSTIFTMTSATDSSALLGAFNGVALQGTVASNSSSTGQGQTNNDSGPAPTTAVAMSILYSITGIITLLFLVIIATGAIRAHRHPERYGPRIGVAGRTRQSRAKGLARAMLETLPIVKFGDPDPVKPGSQDIELEDGNTNVHRGTDATAVSSSSGNEEKNAAVPEVPVASGLGEAQAESIKSGEEATNKEGELGCSICTEDFTTGEDVRVLPCNHKYHPACIDPWLLNVSGTCPLCRHDLRPVAPEVVPASPTAEGSELPPPLVINEGAEAEAVAESDQAANNQRRRVTRFLDLHRLRHAPPDERIAALRQLREQSQQEGVEDVEEPSRRARLTGRLRDTFRIRTRTVAEE